MNTLRCLVQQTAIKCDLPIDNVCSNREEGRGEGDSLLSYLLDVDMHILSV